MLQVNLLPDVKKEFIKAQRTRNMVMTICIFTSIIAIGVVVVLGLIMGAQMLQKNISMGNIERDEKTIQTAQDEEQLNEYLTIQNQLSQIDNLKGSQPVYSRLFDYLRQLNPAEPNNVELSSVLISSTAAASKSKTAATTNSTATTSSTTAKSGGSVELTGTTSNFASLDVFKTTLTLSTITYSKLGANDKFGESIEEPLFTNVSVTQAGISQADDGSRVSFTIIVTYNAAAFDSSSYYLGEGDSCDGKIDKYCPGVTVTVPSETTSDADRNAPQNTLFNSTDINMVTPEESETPNSNSNTNTGGQ